MKQITVAWADLRDALAKIYREGGLILTVVPAQMSPLAGGRFEVTDYTVYYVEARFR